MTEPRRTVKVALDLATLAEMLGLHPSQRVLMAYVDNDPHLVVVVVEGGAELPKPWPEIPDDWRGHGVESVHLRPGEIPHPD